MLSLLLFSRHASFVHTEPCHGMGSPQEPEPHPAHVVFLFVRSLYSLHPHNKCHARSLRIHVATQENSFQTTKQNTVGLQLSIRSWSYIFRVRLALYHLEQALPTTDQHAAVTTSKATTTATISPATAGRAAAACWPPPPNCHKIIGDLRLAKTSKGKMFVTK